MAAQNVSEKAACRNFTTGIVQRETADFKGIATPQGKRGGRGRDIGSPSFVCALRRLCVGGEWRVRGDTGRLSTLFREPGQQHDGNARHEQNHPPGNKAREEQRQRGDNGYSAYSQRAPRR